MESEPEAVELIGIMCRRCGMTENEAIKELHEIRPRGGIIPQKRAEAIDIAINALEKQIPKKPIIKSGESLVHINKGDKPHEWKLNKWCSWCCPVCGWFVGERYNRVRNDGSIHPHDQRKSNYCNECGQAIDWS